MLVLKLPVQRRRRLRKRLKVIRRRLKIYGDFLSEVGLGVTGLKHPVGDKVSEKSSHQGRLQIIAKTRLYCSFDYNSNPNDLSAQLYQKNENERLRSILRRTA